MIDALRRRWRGWRRRRAAWRHLYSLFDHPERLSGTSLRPQHRGRVDVVELEPDDPDAPIEAIQFTILRHPRPYPFSRQYHAVLQLYRYDLAAGALSHVRSLNISRAQGRDGEPPGSGI